MSEFRTLKRSCADRGFTLQKRSNGYLLSPAAHDTLSDLDRSYVELGSLEAKPARRALYALHARVLGANDVEAWIAKTPPLNGKSRPGLGSSPKSQKCTYDDDGILLPRIRQIVNGETRDAQPEL